MTIKERHFFAAGNTARGYITLFDSVLEGMERVYLLTGGVEGIASPLIEQIGRELGMKAGEVEWVHSPFQNGEYDGVLFPKWKVAVMDYSYPRIWKPQAPGLTEISVNLQTALHADRLALVKERITSWYEEFFRKNQEAYACFAEALRIHDEWEAIYIQNLDREKATRITEEMIARLFDGGQLAKKSRVRRMYLGASTPQGPVDHVPNLTEGLEKRYFIKGRPGSGKSTMLNRLLREAEERGFDADVYQCGLDPNSLDMVVLPEKSVAIFDSTAPHEYFPSRESDEVIDMYALAISPGTDEAYAAQIAEIQGRYKQAIKAAIAHLQEAVEFHVRINQAYAQSVDPVRLQAVAEAIVGALSRKYAD
jgi:hypothetical protein